VLSLNKGQGFGALQVTIKSLHYLIEVVSGFNEVMFRREVKEVANTSKNEVALRISLADSRWKYSGGNRKNQQQKRCTLKQHDNNTYPNYI
jgi:hypothetical protein